MSHIAIIPARSGSKRLKNKNIILLNGKPLMAYTIEAAINSGIYDQIHVSTNSEYYAKIARDYGADVPFLRSDEKSTDQASSWDVVKEVLEQYESRGISYDIVTLLQPTSPLRTGADIKEAFELFQRENASAIISVCEVDYSPLLCNTLPADLSMANFLDNKTGIQQARSDIYYRINGAIYMLRKDYLYENNNIYREGCYAYLMDKRRSIDIDTELDFEIAEFLIGKDNNL